MRHTDFLSILDAWASKKTALPALRYAGAKGLETLTYPALAGAVRARAEALRSSATGCLGVLCDGSAACVIEILAAAAAGLQTALLDGLADEGLLAEQIAAADVDTLWGDDELREILSPALRPEPIGRTRNILFFTSGTAQAARAVALTEKSLCASAWNGGALLPLAPGDVLLCMLPLNHVFGFVCGLLWGLSCGACVALGRGQRHYADDCACFRPTALPAVTMLLDFLTRANALNPELKLILVGAGPCPAPLLESVKARGIRASFGYGLTETSSGVALSLGDNPYAMTVCPDDRITIAPDGEILIEAPTCMMRGYYNAPEATAAVLLEGVLHTGDLGSLDDEGRLHVTGRKKDMLVLRDGTKLFLPEYEARLAQVLPGRDFAVLEIDGRPALILRGREEEREAVSAALAPAMAEQFRGRQLSKIIFVSEPLPRSATGKIKRWELQQKVVNA